MNYLIKLYCILCFVTVVANGSTAVNMNNQWKHAISETPPYPDNRFHGKGIVIPAGGEYYLINAYVNLSMLRFHGCMLPVEVWYIGEQEFIPHLIEKLEKLGAKCCDITDYFDYPIKGFEVKPHAVLASSFQEVMLLDADNIPLKNVAFLFETPKYTETGALFWPDLALLGNGENMILDVVLEPDNLLWNVLELTPSRMRGQESGQLIIDKKRCWLALNLCVHMNKNSEFYYKYVYGDKDTFFLSFLATKTPYYMINHLPGLVFNKENFFSDFSGFLHAGEDGEILFLHLVAKNWMERAGESNLWIYYALPNSLDIIIYPYFYWNKLEFKSFQNDFGFYENKCLQYYMEVKSVE